MKKIQISVILIVLSFCLIFAPITGASEAGNINLNEGDIIHDIVKRDTVHKILLKYFPEKFSKVQPSKNDYRNLIENSNSYFPKGDANIILNPNDIYAGRKIVVVAPKKKAEKPEPEVLKSELPGIKKVHTDVTSKITVVENDFFDFEALKEKHVVKDGETISSIANKHYGKSTPKTWEALSVFNDIRQEKYNTVIIRKGKVLKIPKHLVLIQDKVGSNPTVVDTESGVRLAIREANIVIGNAGFDVRIDESMARDYAEQLARTGKEKSLKGRIAIAATYNNYAQQITLIDVDDELYGPYIRIYIDEFAIDIIHAIQCNNVYITIARDEDDDFVPTTPPIPQAVTFLPTGKRVKVDFTPGRIFSTECTPELNNADTAFHDRSVAGGTVDGFSTTTELGCVQCGDHKPVLTFETRHWSGETNDSVDYGFSGDVVLFGVGDYYRVNDNWQWYGRVSSGERKDKGGFENEYVSYRSDGTSTVNNLFSSMEYIDEDERYLSKFKVAATIDLVDSESQTRHDYITDKYNNTVTELDIEPEDQNQGWLIAEADVLSFDDDGDTKLLVKAGAGHQKNLDNTSLVVGGGVQPFKGVRLWTGWTFNNKVADTWNIWNLTVEPFMIYKWATEKISKTQEKEPDTGKEALERTQGYSDDMTKFLEKQISNQEQ